MTLNKQNQSVYGSLPAAEHEEGLHPVSGDQSRNHGTQSEQTEPYMDRTGSAPAPYTQPIRSPVQDEVHVERTIAGGVVAQGRVHANGEEKEDCSADPNPIHDPGVSCQPGERQRGSRRQVHMFLGGAGLGLEVRFVRGSVVKCAGQRLRAGQTRNTASS